MTETGAETAIHERLRHLVGFCSLWQYEYMAFWAKAFRVVAAFLVLFVAGEVLTCDLLPSSKCYAAQSQQQDKDQSPVQDNDNCVCCCAHIVVVTPLIFVPHETVAPALPSEDAKQPVFSSVGIEHPPQLS